MRTKSMMGKCKKRLPHNFAEWKPMLKPDILVKCWLLKNSKPQFNGCCVEHKERVQCVINSSAFKTIMKDLPGQLEELWKHQPSVLVVCADGYGCHRARTLAAILQAYYEQRGFNSKGPFRSTCIGWRMKMCVRPGCKSTITETQQMYVAIGDE